MNNNEIFWIDTGGKDLSIDSFLCDCSGSGVSNILYKLKAFTLSPLDPVSLVTLPTSVRLDTVEIYLLLMIWIILLSVAYWWRTRITISELEEAQLIAGPMGEQWRLGSEGKLLAQIEESSEET